MNKTEILETLKRCVKVSYMDESQKAELMIFLEKVVMLPKITSEAGKVLSFLLKEAYSCCNNFSCENEKGVREWRKNTGFLRM